MAELDRFLRLLISSPQEEPVFNPWYQQDVDYGMDDRGPQIRREHLRRYLAHRRGLARWALIGEAIGYQGGHFSGLAMTSERILLGHKKEEGIHPSAVYPGVAFPRTSQPALKAEGFSEPTATIVWGSLLAWGVSGRDFVLWNAFAWHPFDPDVGMLSNRRPTALEQSIGRPQLEAFLALFPETEIIAVGRVAEGQLQEAGVQARRVRHPAHGGAPKFRNQVRAILREG